MRLSYFALSFLLMLGLPAVAVVFLVGSEADMQAAILLHTAALILLTLPPVIFGAQWQYWPEDPRRGEGAVHFRRWFVLSAIAQLVGAVLTVVVAVLFGIPWWFVLASLAYVVVLTVAIYWLADRLRLRLDAAPALPTDVESDLMDDRRRFARSIAVAATAGLVVAAMLFGVFALLLGEDDFTSSDFRDNVVSTVIFGFVFGMIAAAVPLFRPAYKRGLALRNVTAGSLELTRKLRNRVVRGKRLLLSDGELDIADRYAVLVRRSLIAQTTMFGLIFGAQIPLGIQRVLSGSDRLQALNLITLALFVLALGFLVVVYPGYFRNIDRFQAERSTEQIDQAEEPA